MKKTASFILGTMTLAYAPFFLIISLTAFFAWDVSILKYLWIGCWSIGLRFVFLSFWVLILLEAKP